MAYGRESVMNALRMAGSKLNNLDRAYAAALEPAEVNGPIGYFGALGRSVPLSETIGSTQTRGADGIIRYALPEEKTWKENAYEAGLLGANVASRYMLPAGGITLAGKGLYDLTAAFGNTADYPEPGQLPLS